MNFKFSGDSNEYFIPSGFSASEYGYDGNCFAIGARDASIPGTKGEVVVTYDNGSVSFSKTLKLIAYIPDAVDMGLSVKWATVNVGAKTKYDYGAYFAWGETAQKQNYDWANENDYLWGVYKSDASPLYGMTKYTNYNEGGDGLFTLLPQDDAATQNWNDKWRTPSKSEFDELLDESKCTWDWVPFSSGYNVTSKITGNTIFLPCAGLMNGTSLNYRGFEGNYWSSSLDNTKPNLASGLFCAQISGMSKHDISSPAVRKLGFSIRAVTEY